jgi:hypothetical protein
MHTPNTKTKVRLIQNPVSNQSVVSQPKDITEEESIEGWLNFQEDDDGLTLDDAIGEIAKYLPMGANPSQSNLRAAAGRVLDGKSTAQEEAQKLSSKKIITLKGA